MTIIRKIFAKITIILFIYSFSYCVWYFSKPIILPPLDLQNTIELDVGYVNTSHETFDVLFSNEENPAISYAFGDEGYTQKLTLSIPYVRSQNFKFVFGNEGNIARIDRLFINGRKFPLDDLYNSLYNQKFKVGKTKDGNSVYLVSKGKLDPYNFEFVDQLQYITDDELVSLKASEDSISYSLFFGYFLFFLLVHLLFRKFIKSQTWKDSIGFVLSVFLIILLIHSFCIIVGLNVITKLDNSPNHFQNFIKYESNLIPAILFGMLPLIISALTKRVVIKCLLQSVSLLVLIILIIDNFVASAFLTRFLINGATGYLVDFNTAVSFIKSFIESANGFFAFLSVAVFITVIIKHFRTSLKKTVSFIYVSICFCSLIFAFWPFSKSDMDIFFANAFQVNGITTNSYGNYFRNFSEDYSNRKMLDFEWKVENGLGLKKNVIIILAESLSCDLTKMCETGSEKELAPHLSSIANENLFFNRYYSDAYSTSMAVLTIVKSFPAFPQRNSLYFANNKYTHDLMNQNDLVSAFHNNGYKTAFFSSSDLVFSMDSVLKSSEFDLIFDSKDPIFSKNEKKYIFNSVSDEVLLNSVLNFVTSQPSKQKLFIMTATSNPHVPFDSPWGTGNFDNAFLYSDNAIYEFIRSLEQVNYFEDGIVVITGDHQPWGYKSSKSKRGLFDRNQVPLIIVDKSRTHEVNSTIFSHSSLGIYLQSLMLDSYKLHKFNVDPKHSNDSPLLLAYEFDKQNFAMVKKGDVETRIKFNGDDSEFTEHVFDLDYEQDVLGYLATCGL